jgi:two-component sensor histidine kinase/CheY-like chemotaxis protein
VQSIIRLTRSENMTHYVDAVEGRISALARAHSVLAQSRWQGAALRGLVEDELAPYRTEPEDTVRGGPNAILKPAAAQSLALALHELVTNAAKYGALSSCSGYVDVSWTIQDNSLVIQWIETGGPQVKAPAAQGFGSLIIIAGIEKQLGGRATFEWPPAGLRCTLSIPKESVNIREPTTPLASVDQPVIESFKPINQSRIMVVEDEALVALALAESLSQLGFSVVGPLHNLNDAEVAVTQSAIDGAILDVNLNGRLVYPLADKLVERKVPFVFMTGYGADNIDARFKKVPVLHKPIEQDTLRRVFSVAGRPEESSVPRVHLVGADKGPADSFRKQRSAKRSAQVRRRSVAETTH